MIQVRSAKSRFHTDLGWLDSWHTFSFGDHYDPAFEGFRALRVINDDRVAPGGGFPSHGHRDMEIITYVLEGALAHKDNLGNGSTIKPGDVQRMSAGTGVVHSEYNASQKEPVHFLQIWVIPEARGAKAGYEERKVPEAERRGKLRLIAARDAAKDAVTLHQDASIYASLLSPGEKVRHELRTGRHAWVHLARGSAEVNGKTLEAGDGAALSGEAAVEIEATSAAELLLFDLA